MRSFSYSTLAKARPSQGFISIQIDPEEIDSINHRLALVLRIFWEEILHGEKTSLGAIRNMHLLEGRSRHYFAKYRQGECDAYSAKSGIVESEYRAEQIYRKCNSLVETGDKFIIRKIAENIKLTEQLSKNLVYLFKELNVDISRLKEADSDVVARKIKAVSDDIVDDSNIDAEIYRELEWLEQASGTLLVPRIAIDLALDIPYFVKPANEKYSFLIKPKRTGVTIPKKEETKADPATGVPIDEVDLEGRFWRISHALRSEHANKPIDEDKAIEDWKKVKDQSIKELLYPIPSHPHITHTAFGGYSHSFRNIEALVQSIVANRTSLKIPGPRGAGILHSPTHSGLTHTLGQVYLPLIDEPADNFGSLIFHQKHDVSFLLNDNVNIYNLLCSSMFAGGESPITNTITTNTLKQTSERKLPKKYTAWDRYRDFKDIYSSCPQDAQESLPETSTFEREWKRSFLEKRIIHNLLINSINDKKRPISCPYCKNSTRTKDIECEWENFIEDRTRDVEKLTSIEVKYEEPLEKVLQEGLSDSSERTFSWFPFSLPF